MKSLIYTSQASEKALRCHRIERTRGPFSTLNFLGTDCGSEGWISFSSKNVALLVSYVTEQSITGQATWNL